MDSKSNTFSVAFSVATLLVVVAVHSVLFRVAIRFAMAFESVDSELPMLTRLLVEGPGYFWVLPVLVTAGLVAHHAAYLSRQALFLFSSIGTAVSAFFLYGRTIPPGDSTGRRGG